MTGDNNKLENGPRLNEREAKLLKEINQRMKVPDHIGGTGLEQPEMPPREIDVERFGYPDPAARQHTLATPPATLRLHQLPSDENVAVMYDQTGDEDRDSSPCSTDRPRDIPTSNEAIAPVVSFNREAKNMRCRMDRLTGRVAVLERDLDAMRQNQFLVIGLTALYFLFKTVKFMIDK